MRVLLAGICLLLSGCSTIDLTSSTYDPTSQQLIPCHVRYTVFLRNAESISGNACGGSANAKGVATDAESIGIAAGMALQTFLNNGPN